MPEEARNGADQRPSPEALLAEAGQEGRGRLKIFLGAAPGVGKTYEMLTSARRRKLDGVDVVVGLVETHGRRETAALLAGLEILPRRRVPYRGRELEEMDLDRLLKRRPQLALVDELAHDNAPGSRHPKRWMDVEELLAAGIDVWTTVNVQHVESLNDVVAQITHVRVRETVPDSVLDQAEIELIDLTPDELRERLHEGKVYVPEAAGRALDHYFSHGNLTALRELALRRTAERVDDQMVQYMRAHGLAGPWAAGERLLACVHGGEGAAELVRYTKRLADRLRAPWTAIHVQTAADRRAGEAANDRVADTLRLAERLGGETLVLPGERIADEILAWARGNNVTQIVIGSVRRSGWRDWFKGSLPRDLIRGADDIGVLVLPEGGETAPPKRVRARTPERKPQLLPYLGAVAMVAAATGLGWLLKSLLDLSNVALIFVVPVLAAALAWGIGPGLTAAVLAVLGYNFFFLDPLYTFHISDPENVAGFVLFSAVAVLASGIASRTRSQTLVARQEAARAAALYAFSKKLTGVAEIDDLLWAAAHQVAVMLNAEVVFLLPEDGSLAVLAAYPPEDQLDANDLAAAEWCWRSDTPAGRGSDNLPGAPRLFLPLRTGRGKLGVAGIRKDLAGPLLTPAERRLLDALLDQTALAVDRVQLARDVDASKLLAETERLRTALLTSIGHDLKTPLALYPWGHLGLAQLRRLLWRGRPRGSARDRAGGSRAAGPVRRQSARHDPAGGGCPRPQAGAGRHRRCGRLGPATHRPASGRPSDRDRPAGGPATAARRLRPARAGVGQSLGERRALRTGRHAGRDRRPRRRRRVPARSPRPWPRYPARRGCAHLRPLLPRAQRGAGQGRRPGSRRRQGLCRGHGR